MRIDLSLFYAVRAATFEALVGKLEDIELAAIVRARLGHPKIKVEPGEL